MKRRGKQLPRVALVNEATVSPKGARRWQTGHPWIYRSDVTTRPDGPAGVVRVRASNGRPLGIALWSPKSEISLRLIDMDGDARIDADWWHARIAGCVAAGPQRLSTGNAKRCRRKKPNGSSASLRLCAFALRFYIDTIDPPIINRKSSIQNRQSQGELWPF